MRRPLLALPLAALAVALWPTPAGAAQATRSVALVGDAVLAPARAANVGRFTVAGIHWRGSGRVVFRTRSVGGRWSRWRPAAPEDEDQPDLGSPELRRTVGWRVGNPWWVGPSDRIEARVSGPVSRVRAHLVWSPELRVPFRLPAATEQPAIVPRSLWRANESIRRAPPLYAPSVQFAIVHHTAGRNGYTREEAAAMVRGIQLYHVQSNGWNDIGYNFLVDRFGTVYEGRYGGVDRNVVGAHAQGFNTGSVGIAVLGTYGSSAPARAAQEAVARLIAWRLDLAHVDPTGMLTFVSGGSDRFTSGVPVPLRVVSGHRDTGKTECPGDALYARLAAIAAEARGLGLPKIFDPRAEENDAGIRFTARLSTSTPWTVVVRSAGGVEAGRGAGAGTAIDWTWDTAALLSGSYVWTMSAGSARPASGTISAGGTVTLAVQDATASPVGITPNGDGQSDTATVSYRLTADANITVEILDSTGGVVATVVNRVWTRSGDRSATVDGASLPDGRYGVVITARRADGAEASTTVPLVVSRTLGTVGVVPSTFSPNGDRRKDRVRVTFSLAAPADVRVRVLREGRGVAALLSASLPAGAQRSTWTGLRAGGPVRDGTYSLRVDVTDAVGPVAYETPLVSDTVAPRVRFVPGRRLRIEVSEPAVLRLRIGTATRRREIAKAGVVTIPWGGPAGRRVRALAVDAAGNTSALVIRPAAPG